MKMPHWFGLAVVIFLAYMAGVMWPGIGMQVRSKIGM